MNCMQIDRIQTDLMQMGYTWRNHKQMSHSDAI